MWTIPLRESYEKRPLWSPLWRYFLTELASPTAITILWPISILDISKTTHIAQVNLYETGAAEKGVKSCINPLHSVFTLKIFVNAFGQLENEKVRQMRGVFCNTFAVSVLTKLSFLAASNVHPLQLYISPLYPLPLQCYTSQLHISLTMY